MSKPEYWDLIKRIADAIETLDYGGTDEIAAAIDRNTAALKQLEASLDRQL